MEGGEAVTTADQRFSRGIRRELAEEKSETVETAGSWHGTCKGKGNVHGLRAGNAPGIERKAGRLPATR